MTKYRNELVVLLNGEQVGIVGQGRDGQLAFLYDRRWRERDDAYPLSLSMPLALERHPDEVVRAFLEGLLPDKANVLERWGRELHVSPRNPFALLTHVGEDCAGAVQLVARDRLPLVLTSGDEHIEWLSEEDVAERLRDAIDRDGTGRLAGDQGHFSLAGAQPKTALFHDGHRWGIPAGRVPTTHIIKPPAQKDLDGFDINEHFCLKLARELGLSAPESSIETFGDITAIVVERYDRLRTTDATVARLHQEDACQALGVSPLGKYESDGGPGAPEIVNLLMRQSSDASTDVGAFLDALALNWVIAGTDAHAKNYSVLISPEAVRLAPLYDLLSALPYATRLPYKQLKLSMRIDREYHLWKVRERHWQGVASMCDLDPQPLVQRVAELAQAVPEATRVTAAGVREEGINHEIVDRLEEDITEHASRCLGLLP